MDNTIYIERETTNSINNANTYNNNTNTHAR